jgi:hypothetical protein
VEEEDWNLSFFLVLVLVLVWFGVARQIVGCRCVGPVDPMVRAASSPSGEAKKKLLRRVCLL